MENFNGGKMVSDGAISLLHSLLGECASKSAEESKVDITSCLVGDEVTKRTVSLFMTKLANLVTAHNVAVGVCGLDCNVSLTVKDGVVSMHFSNVKETPKAEPTPKVDPAIERIRKKNAWVDKHYNEFYADNKFYEGLTNSNERVCEVVKKDRYAETTYRAYCSPDDFFDHRVGLAVAYARAKGEQIPDFI